MSEKLIKSILHHSPGTTIGVFLVAIHLGSALLGFLFVPYGPTELAGPSLLAPLSPGYPLGTDIIGRDYLTRLVMGGRTSIFVAMLGALSAVIIGGLIRLLTSGGFMTMPLCGSWTPSFPSPGYFSWRCVWWVLDDPYRY